MEFEILNPEPPEEMAVVTWWLDSPSFSLPFLCKDIYLFLLYSNNGRGPAVFGLLFRPKALDTGSLL